ncbi:MAG: HAMP domain-containing sensor histidine kinase [Myxococcales bacterium]|nr:HAMP domain-containing histidine kinase [Polyangiaceae bacterium]MDW8247905.1 HAMP domain-containing sensor histidine kinase [Myxococcales bacterium]
MLTPPRYRLPAGKLPLRPLAPAVVLVVGVGVAVVMVLFGLAQLRRTSDEGALERALVLARVLAARLRPVAAEDREQVVETLARNARVDLILANQRGETLIETMQGTTEEPLLELLVEHQGFAHSPTGRVAFAVQELEPPFAHLALVVFVHAPATPAGSRGLFKAVAALTLLLVAVAAVVAYVFSRNAEDDVEYVRERLEELAQEDGGTLGAQIPIRTFDQVGVVTAAFNGLLERFAAAERAYRHDLQRAEALDLARSRFLATLSHELRTPLNAILGFAEVLLSEAEGPLTPSAREDLDAIRSSGEHLRSLIDDILDLSAMETGSLRLSRRTVDLHDIAEQVLREAQPLVSGRQIKLELEGVPGIVAWADPRRVRQVLANLVGNAVKFTSEGYVKVRLSPGDGVAILEVIDTGPGIPEEDRSSVFLEYRQAGDASSRRKGTGLGLAIARRLVLAHEGEILLHSELGKGSVFRVTLPSEAPS